MRPNSDAYLPLTQLGQVAWALVKAERRREVVLGMIVAAVLIGLVLAVFFG